MRLSVGGSIALARNCWACPQLRTCKDRGSWSWKKAQLGKAPDLDLKDGLLEARPQHLGRQLGFNQHVAVERGVKVQAATRLNSSGTACALGGVGPALQHGLHHVRVRKGIVLGHLDLTAVHHEDNVIDCDAGFRDVGGHDDLARAGRGPVEDLALVGCGQH